MPLAGHLAEDGETTKVIAHFNPVSLHSCEHAQYIVERTTCEISRLVPYMGWLIVLDEHASSRKACRDLGDLATSGATAASIVLDQVGCSLYMFGCVTILSLLPLLL